MSTEKSTDQKLDELLERLGRDAPTSKRKGKGDAERSERGGWWDQLWDFLFGDDSDDE